jgi:hypothetical protein
LAKLGDDMAMGWSVSSRVSVHVGVVSQLEDEVPVMEAGCAAGVGKDSATMKPDANTATMMSARTHRARPAMVTRGNPRFR